MIKHYLKIYFELTIGVNVSSQEPPDSSGFQGLTGRRRGRFRKSHCRVLGKGSDRFLIYEEAPDEHAPRPEALEQPAPSGPEERTFLQAFSTFSSGFPRPKTISCGLDHCFFSAGIESPESL